MPLVNTDEPIDYFIALVTQTGTDQPEVTILKNDIDASLTITRSAVGVYNAYLEGGLPSARTFVYASLQVLDETKTITWNVTGLQPDGIRFNTKSAGVLTDGLMNSAIIIIGRKRL